MWFRLEFETPHSRAYIVYVAPYGPRVERIQGVWPEYSFYNVRRLTGRHIYEGFTLICVNLMGFEFLLVHVDVFMSRSRFPWRNPQVKRLLMSGIESRSEQRAL